MKMYPKSRLPGPATRMFLMDIDERPDAPDSDFEETERISFTDKTMRQKLL